MSLLEPLCVALLGMNAGSPAVTGRAYPPPQKVEERTIEKEILVDLHARVRVQHSYGLLRVLPSEPSIPPHAVLKVRTTGESGGGGSFLDSVRLEVTSGADGTLLVRSSFPEAERKPKGLSFLAEMELWLPPKTPLEVENRYGPIEVSGWKTQVGAENRLGPIRISDHQGPLKLTSRFDQVDLSRVEGDIVVSASSATVGISQCKGSLRVLNSFGEVRCDRCEGEVHIENRNQPVTLTNLRGNAALIVPCCEVNATRVTGDLQIEGSNAPIVAEKIGGDLTIRHKYGNVTVRDVAGKADVLGHLTPVAIDNVHGPVEIQCTSSSVSATRLSKGLKLLTTSGAVLIEDVDGEVDAATRAGLMVFRWSGSSASSPAAVRLENHQSPIEIELAESCGAELLLTSIGACIESELPGLSVEQSGNSRVGRLVVGNGKNRIEATSNGGAIVVRKRR